MLSRRTPPISISLPSSSTPPCFPGLISSIRPIKRLNLQLCEESLLLHRFSYKNKNQHKAAKWWCKLMGLSRIMFRTKEELNQLLEGFGTSKDSDEMPTISREQVVTGLLQLPRSLLLVEKSIQVLLDCASILEQLIETRAFLAFSLIVVSLIARLHTLSIVLKEELSKLSQVLLGLIDSNNLMECVAPLLRKLPKELRRFIHIQPTQDSIPVASTSTLEELTPIGGGGDDVGAVIVRKKSIPKLEEAEEFGKGKVERVIPVKRPVSPILLLVEEEDSFSPPQPPAKKLKKLKKSLDSAQGEEGIDRKEEEEEFDSLDTLSKPLEPPKKLKSRSTKEIGGLVTQEKVIIRGEKEVAKKKKKKKPRLSGGGDEIDAIFG